MAEEEHRGDHHDPTDDPRARAELNALKEQMEQLQMRHEEEMAALSQQLHSSGPRDVKVHVLPTVTTPKLKLFSGLPPTSNQEATFEEWRQQVVQTIDDEAISDKAAYVRRSLRGAALQQVNALGSNDAMVIVKHLTTLFGVLKSPEEEYLEICQTRPKKDQALSDFLLLTYNRMKDVQERGQFDGSELQRRLYFAFSKGCNNHLLAMEFRNKFGVPGEAKPAFEEVYRYLRQVEDLESSKGRRPTTHGEGHHVHAGAHTTSAQTRKPKRGYCFKCGEEGHFYRDCTNAPNAKLEAQREREKKKRENEWRQKKGLPAIPGNF